MHIQQKPRAADTAGVVTETYKEVPMANSVEQTVPGPQYNGGLWTRHTRATYSDGKWFAEFSDDNRDWGFVDFDDPGFVDAIECLQKIQEWIEEVDEDGFPEHLPGREMARLQDELEMWRTEALRSHAALKELRGLVSA